MAHQQQRFQESVTTENYLITSRDIPEFDGSGSSGGNGSFIQAYIWQIDVPNASWNRQWSNTYNLVTAFSNGQTLQYRPESFFNPAQLKILNITGPFRVTLTVVDNFGFIATSQSTVFTPDPNIAPPARIATQLASCRSGLLTVNITDIFLRPVANLPVLFLQTPGGPLPASPVSVTNVAGQAGTTLSSCISGTYVEVEAGNLQPQFILIGT